MPPDQMKGINMEEEETPPTESETEAPDLASYEAKIAELSATIAERDSAIEGLNGAVSAAKAHNYDLLMQLGTPNEEIAADTGTDESFDIDDLFGEAE